MSSKRIRRDPGPFTPLQGEKDRVYSLHDLFFCDGVMEEKRFQRCIEDFTCGRCGMEVHGTGFTNHCPRCLWSRHVDSHPGDRGETCGGMMRPVALEEKSGEYILVHRCEICGVTRKNRTAPDDSFETILEVMKEFSEGGG